MMIGAGGNPKSSFYAGGNPNPVNNNNASSFYGGGRGGLAGDGNTGGSTTMPFGSFILAPGPGGDTSNITSAVANSKNNLRGNGNGNGGGVPGHLLRKSSILSKINEFGRGINIGNESFGG